MATGYRYHPSALPNPTTAAIHATPPLSIVRIAWQAAAVIGLLLLNKLGLPGSVVFFVVLIGMVLKSPEFAFKALTIGFLGLIANQAIVPKTEIWTVARLLLPMVCLVRFSLDLSAMRQTLFAQSYYTSLVAFIAVAAVLSIMTQYYVAVALLKLFNFACAATAIFSGAKVLRVRRSDFTEWYVLLCGVTVALSFASITAGIGYNMRGLSFSGTLFNGSMYHSNAFGPLAAMMTVYLTCVTLFARVHNRWLCVLLAVCLLYFMAISQSRTAFAALFVGVLTAVGLSFVLVRRGAIRLRINAARFALIGGLAAAGIGVLVVDAATGNIVTKQVVAFANKGAQADSIELETLLSSRRALIDLSWQNFLESPWIGIGFEVATTEYFRANATLFYAPIEKGFLPVAVLEETGGIGAVFFVIFLLALFASLATELNIPGIAMFLTFLAVNCGEAMFFAMGGHGGFGWLLFTGGIMLGDFCVERRIKTPENTRPVLQAV